jgi:PTS system mannitol-specific IIC component
MEANASTEAKTNADVTSTLEDDPEALLDNYNTEDVDD